MLIQLENQYSKVKPRSVFYSYAHKDEELRDELDTHLRLLKREGFISTWHDRRIPPGDDWDHVINKNLNEADVILFLVSQNFLASQYCRDIEVRRAMERYERREAIVIPIILRPCVWTSESFARLQALPKNCRPLVEWQDTGFAQVSEELRTMMVSLIYPRLPGEQSEGQHGNWIMKLRGRSDVDNGMRAREIMLRLRSFSDDFTINLLATATTQVVDGEKSALGLMLVLSGTPEAFSKISGALETGSLSEAVDSDILSFYVVYGATVQGSSAPGESPDALGSEDGSLVLRPGRRVDTPKLIGLILPHGDGIETEMQFIVDSGEAGAENGEIQIAETQKLSDYFCTSLVLKNELLWVNLSAYESDRMLPPELSNTEMGRNMLAQDCMLKRLTASFLHPDSPIGREYWDAVYAEARRQFSTSKLPFRSFQKVWVKASKANVYFATKGEDSAIPELDELTASFAEHSQYAFLVASELDLECEEDVVAKRYSQNGEREPHTEDFALRLFRQIVLPRLREEVNEGEHFAEMRKIYSAEILATFVKKHREQIKSERLRNLVNAGNTQDRLHVRTITPLGSRDPAVGGRSVNFVNHSPSQPIEHATPDAPAFRIPENVEFYAQYIRLFKDGVVRCARSESGDIPDEQVIRVYFSGAINFQNLPGIISEVSPSDPCVRIQRPTQCIVIGMNCKSISDDTKSDA